MKKTFTFAALIIGAVCSLSSYASDNFITINCGDKLGNQFRLNVIFSLKSLSDIKKDILVDTKIFIRRANSNETSEASGYLKVVPENGPGVYKFSLRGNDLVAIAQVSSKEYAGMVLQNIDDYYTNGKTLSCKLTNKATN